jgi:hypothetical protein
MIASLPVTHLEAVIRRAQGVLQSEAVKQLPGS